MGRLREFIRGKKFWFWGGLGVLGVWGILYLSNLPDGKLRLVFCDVGQGDGIYIDLPDGSDVLIDGGPNRKILECLGDNMSFWDRELELVVLTHPQADHLNGLIEVVQRYEIDNFVSSPVGNETKGYKELMEIVESRDVSVRNLYAGDKIKFSIFNSQFSKRGEVVFRVLWPSREFIADKIVQRTRKTQLISKSENQKIGTSDGQTIRNTDSADLPIHRYTDIPSHSEFSERNILGAKTTHDDLNDFSIVMELKFGEFEALLGGDADEEIQDEIMAVSQIRPVEVFKIPHHGSKYGILAEYLGAARPRFAIVSVGKNRWGHPTDEILEKLEVRSVNVLRTDRDGDVTFTTDGKQVWVRSDRN